MWSRDQWDVFGVLTEPFEDEKNLRHKLVCLPVNYFEDT